MQLSQERITFFNCKYKCLRYLKIHCAGKFPIELLSNTQSWQNYNSRVTWGYQTCIQKGKSGDLIIAQEVGEDQTGTTEIPESIPNVGR